MVLNQPDDIKYIIINNFGELDFVIKELKRIDGKYNQGEIERLISRIITVEQIKEDF